MLTFCKKCNTPCATITVRNTSPDEFWGDKEKGYFVRDRPSIEDLSDCCEAATKNQCEEKWFHDRLFERILAHVELCEEWPDKVQITDAFEQTWTYNQLEYSEHLTDAEYGRCSRTIDARFMSFSP